MRLKMIFILGLVYAVTAAPLFLPGELRMIVQPATADAAEVYFQPVSPGMRGSYKDLGRFIRALQIAEQRARAYPDDLAPPYIAFGSPHRLIAPYVTVRGRALASPVISEAYWSEGKRIRYDIVPEVRRVAHSQTALSRTVSREHWPLAEPAAHSMWIDEKTNRVIIQTTTFDQALRRRLAQRYGGVVAVKWAPFEQPIRSR
ncbi:hypothetical protein AB0I81_10195 [Nonomuraea sp. NPDC050404]|uniref:hypothetical protein n=1 Tax=Nonomuraea sp. NPDC050404 TaxID=3155783 RepID=UPI0033E8BE1D